ncbi:Lysophospholipase, alpha-beta hydrolase superfamily [Prosthecobacter debontii]|uniref:Lysophospholipase, alpha-beta hydrolase superfamily n=1 Tax=Prosthecobacter debontii TaxID=48467 RepID=A0A1T4YA32_9BACT|nr:alpha/beta fold hydrolase [Prosthecobacter debontii]SKA98616.1 Lysophospholipase, alpha-beta hydrolase superfamily [Prosthecobacter debontii]
MRLEKWSLSDGTPSILCEPVAEGKLGQRGLKIRQQMLDRGIELKPAGQVVGTLVLVHGRKARKEDYLLIAERLCAVGFRCLLADMPAHGEHPGQMIYYGVREAGLPVRLLKEASERFHFAPQPAGLLGMSMGGSVAVHAADQPDAPWRALVVISSFDALGPAIEVQAQKMTGAWLGGLWAGAASEAYSWRSGLAVSAIQPRVHAARLRMPTLIAHGTQDHVVPMESGRRLYEALPESLVKQWVEVPGADHDNVLITDFPIYATVAEWMWKYAR